MDYENLLNRLDHSRPLIVEAIRTGHPEAAVPTCPDFSLDRLAFHIGEFSSFWTHVVCEGTGRDKPVFPAEPGPSGRAGWIDQILGDLVTELRIAAPDTPCWTWYQPDQSAAFIASRACHELEIHRFDVQLAASGSAEPVDAAVAAAGIEEMLFLLIDGFGVDGRRGKPGNGETLHLHGTDHQPAEWFIRFDPEQVLVTREHAKGDLAIRASVSDLELLLYQRPTHGPVDWSGDRRVLDVFHGEFTFT